MATDETLTVYLTVTAQQGQRVPLNVSKCATPTDLRKIASAATNIPLSSLRLIFRGRMIKDDDSSKVVPEYKLESDCVLHCLGKPADNSASSNPPVPATTTVGASVSVGAGKHPVAQTPGVGDDPLKIGINTLRASNPPTTYLTAVSTLEKVLGNIIANPMEEKYRKVKRQNAAFQRRLGGLAGGDAAMKGAGFVIETHEGEDVYMMHANADAWPKLVAAKATIDAAVQEAKSNASTPPVAPSPAAAPFAGAMPGALPSNFGSIPGGMNPSMNAAMAQMMSDPNALQTMLQVSLDVVLLPTNAFGTMRSTKFRLTFYFGTDVIYHHLEPHGTTNDPE